MYRDAEGQPTIQELLEAEKIAKSDPTSNNLKALATLTKTRTTYWGKDYLIGFRVDDFLRRHGASPFYN